MDIGTQLSQGITTKKSPEFAMSPAFFIDLIPFDYISVFSFNRFQVAAGQSAENDNCREAEKCTLHNLNKERISLSLIAF